MERLLNFYGGESTNTKYGEGSENTSSKESVQQVNDLLTQFLKHKGNVVDKNDLEMYLADKNVNSLTHEFDILN